MDVPPTDQKEVVPQAGGVRVGEPSNTTSSQITTFADQTPAYSVNIGSEPDGTFNTATVSDDELANFFARPILIDTSVWPVDGNIFVDLDPWTQFFNDKRVINRISNYNLLRAKLHVKVVINGNAFYSGRAIASYLPLPGEDELTRNRAPIDVDLINISQRPHFFIDPSLSQGGEMTLPFFWIGNYLSIPLQEWQKMGRFNIRSINRCMHCNQSQQSIYVKTYVWATDVQLAVPTQTNPGGLVPQAGNDEYGVGPISRPATAVANAAGALKHLAMIGPYARATEAAANATAAAASALGYSRPAVISPPHLVKRVFGNLANMNTEDTSTRLTADVKQELTLDPRTVGLDGEDQMTILSIAKRESYLTSFSWSALQSSESRLASFVVDPMQYDYYAAGTTNEMHLTALAYAALPFQYWRGDIMFRFQVVCSGLHRGRLKIVYDPYATPSGTTAEYNTAYTYVVDIAEEKDFTVTVGWGQPTPYRQRYPLQSAARNFAITSASLPLATTNTGNGFLSVYVVEPLTQISADIPSMAVNVFVSAGDNFEVSKFIYGNLSNLRLVSTPYTVAQAGGPPDLGEHTSAHDAPHHDTPVLTMATSNPLHDHTTEVFFGENIVSFRQLLKRYTPSFKTRCTTTLGSGLNIVTLAHPVIPSHRNTSTVATGTPVHYPSGQNTALINYVISAFCGWRGSSRWKVYFDTNHGGHSNFGGSTYNIHTRLRRAVAPIVTLPTWDTTFNTVVAPGPLYDELLLLTFSDSIADSITFDAQHPVAEVEVPFYSTNRFEFARRYDPTTYTDMFINHSLNNYGNPIMTTATGFCSVGEDFSAFFFIGAPILYSV